MKTNELIALLQRIEHHNGGPLTVVLCRQSNDTGFELEVPTKENPDTKFFIQAGSGPRPRIALLRYDISATRHRIVNP